MKLDVRAAVATATIAHANRSGVSSIYDHGASSYRMIDARISGDALSAYDYTSGCHFDGTVPNLFHYGQGAHVDFQSNGDGRYEGYDYGSGSFWEATVAGNQVEIYDYGSGDFHSYSA